MLGKLEFSPLTERIIGANFTSRDILVQVYEAYCEPSFSPMFILEVVAPPFWIKRALFWARVFAAEFIEWVEVFLVRFFRPFFSCGRSKFYTDSLALPYRALLRFGDGEPLVRNFYAAWFLDPANYEGGCDILNRNFLIKILFIIYNYQYNLCNFYLCYK